jgi:hypothetical protein
MIKCLRCGKCCHWQILDMPEPVRCRYLIGDKITSCRIYRNRLGKLIGSYRGLPIYCNLRANVSISYDGCPFNTESLNS